MWGSKIGSLNIQGFFGEELGSGSGVIKRVNCFLLGVENIQVGGYSCIFILINVIYQGIFGERFFRIVGLSWWVKGEKGYKDK